MSYDEDVMPDALSLAASAALALSDIQTLISEAELEELMENSSSIKSCQLELIDMMIELLWILSQW
jgi:hypothetical protein